MRIQYVLRVLGIATVVGGVAFGLVQLNQIQARKLAAIRSTHPVVSEAVSRTTKAPISTSSQSGGAVLLVLCVALYFLPTLIAGVRNHHNFGPVLLVNLLLGWTVIGWIVALIWSSSYVPRPESKTALTPTTMARRYCAQCGESRPEGGFFCVQCGAKFA